MEETKDSSSDSGSSPATTNPLLHTCKKVLKALQTMKRLSEEEESPRQGPEGIYYQEMQRWELPRTVLISRTTWAYHKTRMTHSSPGGFIFTRFSTKLIDKQTMGHG